MRDLSHEKRDIKVESINFRQICSVFRLQVFFHKKTSNKGKLFLSYNDIDYIIKSIYTHF